MPVYKDGPASRRFSPVDFKGTENFVRLAGVSQEMRDAALHAPTGNCISWGIPFTVKKPVVAAKTVTINLKECTAEWLILQHTTDRHLLQTDKHGIASPTRGQGSLATVAANYIFVYEDGAEHAEIIKNRFQTGAFSRGWGENCVLAVAHNKPKPIPANYEQPSRNAGRSHTRADAADGSSWINWLWAWENPRPHKKIIALRIEPGDSTIVLSAISAGKASSCPLRWESRQKAVLKLPRGAGFDPSLDAAGCLKQVTLDMGQVISAQPRMLYPTRGWPETYNNKIPEISENEILVEYTAHPDAAFHLPGGKLVPVAGLQKNGRAGSLRVVPPALKPVTLRVVEKKSRTVVPVKLHIHGEAGEYLAPVDRHRIPNTTWFEDYSVDFVHAGTHRCTYIPGETVVDLPLGTVYIEVAKGYEIKPVRKTAKVTGRTSTITIEVDRVLPWREKGWVSADTHVHFLSPHSALLEGSAEGVNVVNLLASQWGELMTNVGDFDGRSTVASEDNEHLVRVGTENRQHVMGHISLLGYEGNIIAPMTSGGPDESAIGDPVGALLTEWARRCQQQNGLVVIPHFPNPRLENAAAIVDGSVDGVEMTSWQNLYGGISPYSLSDWYRYLNCGYMVAAVAGTDKMTASTAVGTIRTYAQVDGEFSYDAWKRSVKDGRTFVTYGPLMEFAVEGKTPGSHIRMKASGGTVDVSWKLASVTVPMSRVELVVNGEFVESKETGPWKARGNWSVKVDRSSWIALLVRGHYRDKPEIIAAHSSPVMVEVKGSSFYSEADALTILEQIEGALAYIDTMGTRAEDKRRKELHMILASTHRRIHNQMHANGYFHKHNAVNAHHGPGEK